MNYLIIIVGCLFAVVGIAETFQLCPDNKHYCDSGSVCCNVGNVIFSQFLCCEGSCNSVHCTQSTVLDRTDTDFSSWKVGKYILNTPNNIRKLIVCPDDQTVCDNDSESCCLRHGGRYGCCPYVKAVCCNDLIHCCPHDYICRGGDTCQPLGTKLYFQDNITASEILPGLTKTNICPDKKVACNADETCVIESSGKYGCCPHRNAVNCPDKEHCCPENYQCGEDSSECTTNDELTLLKYIRSSDINVARYQLNYISTKAKSLKLDGSKQAKVNRSRDIICPDGRSECEDGSTCCELPSGSYGCCPYERAVCCSDHESCCPHGTTCDVAHSSCIPGMVKSESVICPDGRSQCPDGSTCCKLPSGEYGCCPYERAVCCKDHIHCCPHGTTCDLKTSECMGEKSIVPFGRKYQARNVTFLNGPKRDDSAVLCPDKIKKCPDGFTCCKLPAGDYGCCPQRDGVCCDDHIHCCPRGSKCAKSGCKAKSKYEMAPIKAALP